MHPLSRILRDFAAVVRAALPDGRAELAVDEQKLAGG